MLRKIDTSAAPNARESPSDHLPLRQIRRYRPKASFSAISFRTTEIWQPLADISRTSRGHRSRRPSLADALQNPATLRGRPSLFNSPARIPLPQNTCFPGVIEQRIGKGIRAKESGQRNHSNTNLFEWFRIENGNRLTQEIEGGRSDTEFLLDISKLASLLNSAKRCDCWVEQEQVPHLAEKNNQSPSKSHWGTKNLASQNTVGVCNRFSYS